MAVVFARRGVRCQEHPHREAEQRCDRCGLGFCEECLIPGERAEDGTRPWRCARCVRLIQEEAARAALERSLAHRAAVTARRVRRVTIATTAAAVLIAASTLGYFAVARRFGRAVPATAEGAASCGELSRIRSVGAIGAAAPDDVVNVLTYPHRGSVRLVGGIGAADLGALLDECAAGWRGEPGQALPLTLEIEVRVEGTVSVQRLALWQDPQAPRGAWIRDFEVLVSPSVEGEGFAPVPLDRPARLEPTVEQQWFSIVEKQAFGLTIDRLARGGAQATGTQPGPDVAQVRRLRLRVLSTHAAAFPQEAGAGRPAVALGEVAAYGPDQELGAGIVCVPLASGGSCAYEFRPREVRALAGRPRFVYFVNDTDSPHTFTTLGQDKNADVRVGPGQSASIPFTAAGRGGRYEFFCRISDHAAQGMRGVITVR